MLTRSIVYNKTCSTTLSSSSWTHPTLLSHCIPQGYLEELWSWFYLSVNKIRTCIAHPVASNNSKKLIQLLFSINFLYRFSCFLHSQSISSAFYEAPWWLVWVCREYRNAVLYRLAIGNTFIKIPDAHSTCVWLCALESRKRQACTRKQADVSDCHLESRILSLEALSTLGRNLCN